MKKYLAGFLAIVFAIVLSSFTIDKPSATPENNVTEFMWHKYNEAGTEELVPAVQFFGTEEEARVEFGCPNNGLVICARAYDGETGLDNYIRKPAP